MKFKRTVRILAIVLALTMMPLWVFGCGRLDAKVGDRLAEVLEGGKYDTKSESGKLFLAQLDAKATEINGTVSIEGAWPSSVIKNEDSTTIAHYRNIYTLTKAWATKGSVYYHKSAVLKNIKNALEHGYEKYYGTPNSAQSQRDWTDNERINVGEFLVNSLLILDANNKLSNKNIKKYAEILEFKFPFPIGDAVFQNRSAYIIIGTAALMGDSDRIKDVSEKYVVPAFNYVTSGDGLYADGSYIANGKVSSTASYGVMAFSTLTSLLYALNGTAGDIPDDINAEEFLYNWAIKSVIPSIYNGSAIATVTGSYVAQSDVMGGEAVSALLLLTELLDDAKANEIKGIIKAYSSSGNTTFISHLTNYGISAFQKVETNEKLIAKSVTGNFAFTNMDKLIVSGPRYAAALSLSSIRSAKFETRRINLDKNAEVMGAINGQGWFEGDGMLLVYNPYYQVPDTYWEYVNYGRLPGTTVDNRTRNSYNSGGYTGSTSYAGFVTQGEFSVAANHVYNNNNEYLSDLNSKKSWFIFDDEIVCLGAGISNTTLDTKVNIERPHAIESVVENIFYGDNTSIILSADDPGNPNNEFIPNSTSSTVTSSSLFFSKYGGVYVPTHKNDTLNARLSKTSGGNFIELWFNHGATPKNATYEYALLPGATISEFFEYTEAVGYTVISNNDKLQAVEDKSSGAFGFTFWEGTTVAAHNTAYTGVLQGADFACTVLVKADDTNITISISDFTHLANTNATGGTLTVAGAHTLVSADAGITFSGNAITVDRTVAAAGQTLTLVISK